MSSLNKATIIGRLGDDPEVRYMPNGDAVASFSVATRETWKDKSSGEKKETTEWHKIVLFRRLAEVARDFLKKGSLVYIEGKIKTRKWQDKEGKDRYTTEIHGDELKMLEKKNSEGVPAQNIQNSSSTPVSGVGFGDFKDDIPF